MPKLTSTDYEAVTLTFDLDPEEQQEPVRSRSGSVPSGPRNDSINQINKIKII